MAQKKYASLTTLQNLVGNIKNIFATKTDVNTELAKKADSSHAHSISNVTNLQTTLDDKVPTSRTINSKPLSADITLSASDVGADTKGSATAVQENLDVVSDTLNAHTGNSDIHFTATERTKLSGIAVGAQVNTVTGVKGNSESTYRTGNINITKANIGLGNVDNTADANKTVKHAATADSATSATSATKATQDASGNVITSTYETKTDASSKLAEAKGYTDTKTFGLASTTVVDNKISTHNTSTSAHNDIRTLITGLTNRLNTLADSDDTTLDQMSEIVSYIKSNKSLIDSVTTNKVNVADIINNLTTNVTNKPLSAAQGVEIKRLIDALDSALDTHDANTTKHITSTERTNWNNAKTLAENALPLTGGTISGIITTTDGDAFNRNVTTSGTYYYGGTNFDDGAFLGLYGKDQSAYAGQFILKAEDGENFTYLEGRPDGILKWGGKNVLTLDSTGVVPIIDGGTGAANASDALKNLGLTATATELNYMDGATNNIQAQLDSLSSDLEDHTHSASDITSGTMDAAILPKASETANGIVTTSSQTFAGVKTFTGQIRPAGVLTSGSITASTDSTYDIGSNTSAFRNAYIDKVYFYPQRINGSTVSGGTFEVEKEGTTSATGISKLTIGNQIKEGVAGNLQGFIKVYNENNGSVTLQTAHSDDHSFRVNLPESTGTIVTNNDVYTKEEQAKTLIYDSGEITSKAHSVSNIEVYGYTHFLVAVACVNDGSNVAKSGSAIFKSNDGTTYQFPVWTNMFSTSTDAVSGCMAEFEIIDGYIMCPYASRGIRTANFFSDTEGGTADNLAMTGSGLLKCTKGIKYLTISSLDQDTSCSFGVGSRVMVWGWNA